MLPFVSGYQLVSGISILFEYWSPNDYLLLYYLTAVLCFIQTFIYFIAILYISQYCLRFVTIKAMNFTVCELFLVPDGGLSWWSWLELQSWCSSFFNPLVPGKFKYDFKHSNFNLVTCYCMHCPSVHPALVTLLQSTICNGFCSYFIQPLTLVRAWTLSIMGSLCSFCRILCIL